MGPRSAKLLVQEKNKDILGVNYETIKKHHDQMLANQEKKKNGQAASKDSGKFRLPRHYEPKGLV